MSKGKPCEHNLGGRGRCKACQDQARREVWELRMTDPEFREKQRLRSAAKYLKRRAAQLQKQKENYDANPRLYIERSKNWQRNNQEKFREITRGQVFSKERPLSAFLAATHCVSCGRLPEPKNALVVDHDHSKVGVTNTRDPIHKHCNSLVGLSRERPWVLRAAAKYIEKHRGWADEDGLVINFP